MNVILDDEIEKIFKDVLVNVVNSKGLSIYFGIFVCKNERIVKKFFIIVKENNLFIVDFIFFLELFFVKIGK